MPHALSVARIGESLDFHKRTYGDDFEVNTYRPDLYPPSYIFTKGGITVTVIPLPIAVAEIGVFFESVPPEPVELLLERYSGVPGWENRRLTDPAFALHFSPFSTTDRRNSFFTSTGVFALVQRDVGLGKLVLWIQATNYPSLLEQYRNTKKNT